MDRIEKRLVLLYSLRKKQLDKVLKDYGLTYEDYQVIKTLRFIDGASIEDIREAVGRHLTSTQRIVDALIENGLIEMNADRIYLTEAVKKLYPQIKKLVKKADEAMMSQITHQEHDEMINILDKLIEHYE